MKVADNFLDTTTIYLYLLCKHFICVGEPISVIDLEKHQLNQQL